MNKQNKKYFIKKRAQLNNCLPLSNVFVVEMFCERASIFSRWIGDKKMQGPIMFTIFFTLIHVWRKYCSLYIRFLSNIFCDRSFSFLTKTWACGRKLFLWHFCDKSVFLWLRRFLFSVMETCFLWQNGTYFCDITFFCEGNFL